MYLESSIYNEDATLVHIYLNMIYHATFVFSLIDIAPRTNMEILLSTFLMLVSAIVNAQIYGQVGVLTAMVNQQAVEFENNYDLVNTAMKANKITDSLSDDIRIHILKTFKKKQEQDEMK